MIAFPGRGFNDTFFDGWYQINTEGLSNLYISIADEGIVTCKIDTPASKVFRARIVNPETFSIKRAPTAWPHGSNSQMAAYGELVLDDYDGLYTYLVGADLRDITVIISLPQAMPFGIPNLIADAPIIATAILDNCTSDNEDIITLVLKDTLARLDRPLPMRYLPPFVDSGAANRMVPFMQGACHNFTPLLIDSPNRFYIMADTQVTNVTAVRDMAAPLDPNASPPQYTPALSGSGLQLETLPVGKLTVDASSVGSQTTIPGIDDVLGGIGALASWTAGVPDGWDWSATTGSSITEIDAGDGYHVDHAAKITSTKSWAPTSGVYGDYLTTETAVLKGGKAYRLYFEIILTYTSAPQVTNYLEGGIMVRSALSNNAADAISPHAQPLTTPLLGDDHYVFEYRCPIGADRKIYFLANAAQSVVPGVGVGFGGGIIAHIVLEELGEYLELPLTGITLKEYFTQVLLVRANEDASIIETSDLEQLDSDTGYLFGNRYTEQPNILDVLQQPLDSYCGVMYTSATGAIRVARLQDPFNCTVIADFDETNMDRPISIQVDDAKNLTTLIGTTRNWDPLTDSDFVTDYDIVPAEIRTRYKERSQYQRTSSKHPAGQYDFAVGAPIFDSLLDDPEDGQTEIDRVVSIWSPNVYTDGTVITGKRRFITFTARWDDPAKLGVTTQCDVTDIGYGKGILINYPRRGFVNTKAEVVAWEIFPFAQTIVITAMF